MMNRSFIHRLLRLRRCERGSPMVEFILAMPFVFLIGLAVMELGQVIWQHHVVSKGVRDGVRYLTRVPLPDAAGGCPGVAGSALVDDGGTGPVETAKQLAMASDVTGADFWNDVSTITVCERTIDNSADIFNGPDTIRIVQMTAVLDFGWISFAVSDEARHIGE
jgi:hypothetical protein